jgi:hypothetical protein
MKNSNDTIGNRTRDLPTCSAVPQPNALPRAPSYQYTPLDIRGRQSGRNVNLTSHLHLIARLKLRGSIPPLPNMSLYLVLKLITDTTLQSPRRRVN